MNQFYDLYRDQWVKKNPEEWVRNNWVAHLIQLGFPQELITIEKQLRSIEYLQNMGLQIPNRRIDILCFYKKKSVLKPLLVIECKQGKLQAAHKRQLIGYNHYIGSAFMALANEKMVQTFWHDGIMQRELDFIPAYRELVASLTD